MPTNKIDFRLIASRNGSQQTAFEEFCCQIAKKSSSIPANCEYIRYRGDGGDGGVECIQRFPNGDEWGWQAKYIFKLSSAKTALDESLSVAIQIHPKLTKYYICLPFDLTGPTNRKGVNQRQQFDDYRTNWEKTSLSFGVKLEIVLWTPSDLLTELLGFDKDGGRLHYWFDEKVLSTNWFSEHLRVAKASAYPRYTPELNIETPLRESLEALGLTEEWFSSLKNRTKTFKNILKDWQECLNSSSDPAIPLFPDSIRSSAEQASECLNQLSAIYFQIAQDKSVTTDNTSFITKANKTLEIFKEVYIELFNEFEAKHGKGKGDSEQFRQFSAEYQLSFPAANLDTAKEIIQFLEELISWLSSPSAQLIGESKLLVLGQAGAGKTHGICDVADIRQERGLCTLVLFGQRFNGIIEPWEQIRQLLGFDANFSRDAMLEAFDAAGETSGKPLLLCIDGLNETRPRTYWRNHLSSFIEQLRHYKFIHLCISCRSTYESHIIPHTLKIPKIVHQGFVGIEFNACKAFFDHYSLEPPVMPILQPEFSNPLFLRLVCHTMVKAGHKRLPYGWYGLNTTINALIKAENEAYALEHETLPQHRIPEHGLKAFVSATEIARSSKLPWEDASKAIESAIPLSQQKGSLMDWLIRESFLIVDASPKSTPENSLEEVRLAFERLGDHLLASKLLDGHNTNTIVCAFNDSGLLNFTIADTFALAEYKGLLEALSIQIPERFGIELLDCDINSSIKQELAKITVESLPWREHKHLTQRTTQILEYSFSLPNFAYKAFEVALAVALYSSLMDAYWLDKKLASIVMAKRDSFWCWYLHKSYEMKGNVQKLIQAAFEVKVDSISTEIVERWATVLIWFCAAADRRVRDYATKALVQITESIPKVWCRLLSQFVSVDDEYVIERCLAACYGALLRNRSKETESAISELVFREVFGNKLRFQNAIVRDYARSILDLAKHDQALPKEISDSDYLPPYQSEWPLVIPKTTSLKNYTPQSNIIERLYQSCTKDDFYVYTLSELDSYKKTIKRRDAGLWVFQQVLSMGYTVQQFANYDGYMLYTYGQGRGRKGWAERIGKKYQWIALAQLMAKVTDNATPERDEWDPDLLGTPLTYERGRNIDPSFLIQLSSQEKQQSWWFSEKYDFTATSLLSNNDWATKYDDLPNSANIILEHADKERKKWTLLQGYPEWISRTEDTESSEPYKLIWMQIRSYFISATDSNKCWSWAQRQDFFGRWMPEGAEFHEGFIGEYPWAISFNLYNDSYLSRGGHDSNKTIPCEISPTSNTLQINNEYDSYQEGSISIMLPARQFFKLEPLYWNRAGGYLSTTGQLLFLDPSVTEPGYSVLLVNTDFLKDFLAKNQLAIIWVVIGEKLIINGKDQPRLVFSRSHILDSKGFRSSKVISSSE